MDKNLKVYQVITCQTDETNGRTEVKELAGVDAPFAFFINHGAHGYAKFVVDERTLLNLEKSKIINIEGSMNRKHLYMTLYDMIKSHRIAGSRVLSIMAENLAEETAEDVIKYVLQLIPIIISSFVPIESVTSYNVKLFMALIALMESGKFTATSSKQMLINSLFSFC